MENVDFRRPEGHVHQGMRRFRGIALAPVRLADPVAELQPEFLRMQPRAADERAGLRSEKRCRLKTRIENSGSLPRRGEGWGGGANRALDT